MKSFFLGAILTLASFQLFAQPANDDCTNAFNTVVQSGSCVTAGSGTTVAATASTQTAFIPASADDDVWFKFTTGATGTAGGVKVVVSIADVDWGSTSPQNIILELRDAVSGICNNTYANSTNLSSTGGLWTITGLNPSTNYSVRVYTDGTTSRLTFFGFCVFQPVPPANDDCNNATSITITSNTGEATQTGGTMGATTSAQTSGDGTGKDDDVWFTFTTPASAVAVSAAISNQTYDAGFGQPVIELWDACTDAGHINWYPFATNANFGTLTASHTYRVRIYTYGTSSRFSAFKLTINFSQPPPANDNYANSIAMTLNSGNTCTAAITGGTTVGATEEGGFPACGGATDHKEVWYKFVATKSTAYIQLTNVTQVTGSSTTMVMDVFENSNTNVPKLCSNTGILNFDASTAGTTLTAGATYYIRVYNQDASSTCTFNICNNIPPGATYGTCSKAVNLTVGTDEFGGSNAISLTNVNGDKGTLATGACTVDQWNSVWIRFVAPANPSTYQFAIQNYKLVTGSGPIFYVGFYSGTCGALTQIFCNTGSLHDLPSGLTAGQTYYINITTSSATSQGNFDVLIRKKPATPANTSCANAITLTASADNSAAYTSGTTLGITAASANDCFGNSSPNRIAWYKFVATSSSHFVDITDFVQLDNNSNSAGIRVRQGTCAALTDLGTPVCIFGAANQNQAITGLTPGSTYYIEVMENTFNGGAVSYKLRVTGTTAPANDESAGAINLVMNPTCTATKGTLRFSTMSANPPAGTFAQDVWYKFAATAATATVTISTRLAPNPQVSLYNNGGTVLIDAGGFGTTTFTGLTPGTIYFVRLLNAGTATANPNEDFTICISGTPSLAAADAPTPGSNCITIDGPVNSTNSQAWLHLTHQGKMVASVFDNPGGGGMGNIIGKYYINSGVVRADGSGIEYLNRNFEITPASQPTNPVLVRLYFTKAEFESLVNANDGDGNDVFYLNDLKISKFSSNPCSNTLNLAGEVLYNITGFGSLTNSVYYVEVTVPSFSSFFLKNVNGGVLPVSCADFTAQRRGNITKLRWTTATETNAGYYEVQRSVDGKTFTAIGRVNANGNSNIASTYYFADENIASQMVYYYRLLAVDKDGSRQFACNTVKVSAEEDREKIFGFIYPNPVKSELNVQLNRSYTGSVGMQVISTTGQLLQSRSISLQGADTRIRINTSNLATGIYILRLQTVDGIKTIRFTKE